MVQEAKKKGFEVSEESVNKVFDGIKKNNNVTDQQFETMLENEGRSLEDYKKVIHDQILVSKIVRMHMETVQILQGNRSKNTIFKTKKIIGCNLRLA